MTKWQFADELRHRLQDLPDSERNRYVDYYLEMIEDRMEEGVAEEDAVAALGSLNDIESRIRSEHFGSIPFKPSHAAAQRNLKSWHIAIIAAALVLLFPMWIGLLFGAFGILMGVFAVLLSLWIVVAAFGFAGIGLVIGGLCTIPFKGAAFGLFSMGAGFFLIGMSILLFFLARLLLRLLFKGIRAAGRGIARLFRKREAVI